MDWLTAVVAGCCTKAVEVMRGEVREKAEEMLEEWMRRTKGVFFKQHRHEEVACWFIYVMLEQKSLVMGKRYLDREQYRAFRLGQRNYSCSHSRVHLRVSPTIPHHLQMFV